VVERHLGLGERDQGSEPDHGPGWFENLHISR
jgi:hypothetical protein